MKNITLSADENLIERVRAYARTHGTTLNQLVRDYLTRLCGPVDLDAVADEFAVLSRSRAGCSKNDSPLDRDAIHQRGGMR